MEDFNSIPRSYSEPCQTFKMEIFAKTTIFVEFTVENFSRNGITIDCPEFFQISPFE